MVALAVFRGEGLLVSVSMVWHGCLRAVTSFELQSDSAINFAPSLQKHSQLN